MASNYNETTAALQETVTDAMLRASLSAGRIGGSASPTLKETGFSHTVLDPNLGEPPKFSDLFDGGDDVAAAVNTVVDDQVDEWLAKYFPAINSGFQNVPEDYLIGVISGVRPFGIDSTIFDLVWHKARDRADKTVNSEKATLRATFSNRGFSLPPGALVAAIAGVEQRATDAVLDVNRDEAIKDAEIKKDLLQAAVNVAAQLKQGILNTSAEFFRAYFGAYQLKNESARARAAAYSAYYQALSTFYGVEVAIEKLKVDAAETKASVDNAIDRNRLAAAAENGAAAAHAQAARGFADVAAAASNAAGTLVAQVETGEITT